METDWRRWLGVGYIFLMARRKECPWPEFEDSWIELPDSWLGEHVARRDMAITASKEKELGPTLTDLSVALALLDNWNLPGLTGPATAWDFEKLDLRLIVWISNTTLLDFMKCWAIPKNSSPPSPNGLMEEAAETEAPGLLEEA